MAKRRTVGGVSMRVVRVKPFDHRHGGMARLWVNKDRHSGVRQHCPPPKPGQNEVLAGVFVLGAAGVVVPWCVAAPEGAGFSPTFRPTVLMERLSKAMEEQREPLIKSHAINLITGNKKAKGIAFDLLKDEGYLATSAKQTKSSKAFESAKPYREADDPLADEQELADKLRSHLDEEGGDADEDG